MKEKKKKVEAYKKMLQEAKDALNAENKSRGWRINIVTGIKQYYCPENSTDKEHWIPTNVCNHPGHHHWQYVTAPAAAGAMAASEHPTVMIPVEHYASLLASLHQSHQSSTSTIPIPSAAMGAVSAPTIPTMPIPSATPTALAPLSTFVHGIRFQGTRKM